VLLLDTSPPPVRALPHAAAAAVGAVYDVLLPPGGPRAGGGAMTATTIPIAAATPTNPRAMKHLCRNYEVERRRIDRLGGDPLRSTGKSYHGTGTVGKKRPGLVG
jgi:hypothetical protein